MRDSIITGKNYRHYKGNEYKVLSIGTHTETMERLVVYREIDGKKIWIRPYDMFNEEIEINGVKTKRFTLVI